MEYKKIKWEDKTTAYTLKVRNVGNKNPNAQIQMSFDRYNKVSERSMPFVCIDIPQDKVALFLEALKEVKD